MKAIKSAVFVMILVSLFAVSVHAGTTIFDSNSTITDGNSFDIVVVKGDGTVVDMTGGTVNKVITMDASTFNMSGGSITGKTVSYDLSTLNLSDGNTTEMCSYGQSMINLSGTANVSSYCHFYAESVVTISSNDIINNAILYFHHKAKLNMSGGVISKLQIDNFSNCTMNISGGTVNTLHLDAGDNVVNISGGTITKLLVPYSVVGSQDNVVNIIGYDLMAVPYGGSYGEGQVDGYWNDDTAFSIGLGEEGAYGNLVLCDGFIPPNCVNKPESDLDGDCKVNFVDLSKITDEWLDDGTE
ncbi:MAG: hypothetical protein ACYSSI_07310 [Planctomycetota bacterium]